MKRPARWTATVTVERNLQRFVWTGVRIIGCIPAGEFPDPALRLDRRYPGRDRALQIDRLVGYHGRRKQLIIPLVPGVTISF